MSGKKLTHLTGTFLIQADAAFLNGAGLGEGEDQNVTIPKTFRDGKNEVPYVSAQAWRRWLRNTLIEETKWQASELKAIGWNPKGNVNKIAAELNPVDFVEDDIFGYMRAEKGQGLRSKEGEEGEEDVETRTKSIMRASPFMSSILISLRTTGWKGRDEGFVHLTKYDPKALAEADIKRFLSVPSKSKTDVWDELREYDKALYETAKVCVDKNELGELRRLLLDKAKDKGELDFIKNPCSPLPYTTRFYHTNLQGVFCLNYGRLGVFWNLGDRIELEESIAKRLLLEEKIKDVTKEEAYKSLSDDGKIGRIYMLADKVKPAPKDRAIALIKALAVLRGGAKQAQFGTDVSPKVLVIAGLTCGNPIFNNLFRDDQEGPVLKVETLKEIIQDYTDRILTPVFIGIRTGYLKNENEVKTLDGMEIKPKVTSEGSKNNPPVKIIVKTPIDVALAIGQYLQ